jgi:hypothetical protein
MLGPFIYFLFFIFYFLNELKNYLDKKNELKNCDVRPIFYFKIYIFYLNI